MAEISSAGRIVVGVDGSPGSKWALAWAAGLAKRDGVALDVITVWEFTTWWGLTPVPANYSAREEAERSVREALDEVVPERPAKVRLIIRKGHPVEALVEKSPGALLLVVGSTGRGRLRRLLHGSVSSSVAARAACPVLIARPPAVPDAPVDEFVGEVDSRR